MIKKIVALILIAISFASCVSSKEIVYFQGGGANTKSDSTSSSKENNAAAFETTLKADDILLIIVSAPDPLVAMPFNLPVVGVQKNGEAIVNSGGQTQLQTYLIDRDGNINFPVIGTLKMGGLTKAKAFELLTTELKKYINSPIVNLRIVNYKVSVLGEVARPGSYNIPSERITLPEVLSMAGDMTIYGVRNEIIVLREVNGVKTYNNVDITNADFINSSFYYLTQNDVVYVKPNNTRVKSSGIGPNTTLIISSLSLLITIVALLVR